jgi:hypothetical protein
MSDESSSKIVSKVEIRMEGPSNDLEARRPAFLDSSSPWLCGPGDCLAKDRMGNGMLAQLAAWTFTCPSGW